MSPPLVQVTATTDGFPRVSGDEPREVRYFAGRRLFSPRERG